MVETDWGKILNFSQKELSQIDKEQLCESLSWMEADDIEINFTDLKTLFRLSQDILKFKGEQVNTLLGQIESLQGKNGSRNNKPFLEQSPTRSVESPLDTIAHQEEIIKVNKEILEQLYFDIMELEGKKNKLVNDKKVIDRDSDSSRDALSEMDAVRQLEKEVSMKNKHIRKLIVDIKVLEEENGQLKDKISVLKEKLKEATQIIEKLTEQLYSLNSNSSQLKEALGICEQQKSQLASEIEALKIKLRQKDSVADDQQGVLKAKIQHWKNIARSKKSEIESITNLNAKLKEDLKRIHHETSVPKLDEVEGLQHTELKTKLVEASNKILQSAHIIELLKAENNNLKSTLEEATDSVSMARNETDEGKEKIIVKKLKRKIHSLTYALQTAENLLSMKEKELIEITSQLHLLENGEEGLNILLNDFKSTKRQLKLKDEGIKSFVKEINALNNIVDNLQLENVALRENLNIPCNEIVPTTGILKKYHDLEMNAYNLNKKIFDIENELVTLQLENREKSEKIHKLKKSLQNMGVDKESTDEQICEDFDNEIEPMPTDGGGESTTALTKLKQKVPLRKKEIYESNAEMKAIIDENEGLRKGLKEILDVLKENNTSTGTLAVECPSLEAVLTSMEARHAAGWFAPHMAVVLELRSAIGGRDALLTALNEARKETYEFMIQLSKESQKSIELEDKILEMEKKNKEQCLKTEIIDHNSNSEDLFNDNEILFGNWMSKGETSDINLCDKSRIDNIKSQGNNLFQNHLKEALTYFHKQYKSLYDKMTDIAIKTSDEQNKWIIQEEKYKAEIESLKSQFLVSDENDQSENSIGAIDIPNLNVLQRKCAFLEESYKYVRTLNENLKNELLENKRNTLIMISKYENKIQDLILNILNLTDRLRNSIPLEVFLKQNEEFNDIGIKYRQLIDDNLRIQSSDNNLFEKLENDRVTMLNNLQRELSRPGNINSLTQDNTNNAMSNAEHAIVLKQLQNTCQELTECENKLRDLTKVNIEMQISEKNIIDNTLDFVPRDEILMLEEQLQKIVLENKTLKNQCKHIESQLDIALIQLQDKQQRQMNTDMEINMLRHQILDLQSTSDNKAIISRLSGEILVSHLHASDNHKIIERLNSSLNKEKQMRLEAEDMLQAREKIFNVYAARYEYRFRHLFQIIQILRQQYQGCVPLVSVENYLNNIVDSARNKKVVDDTLNELDDLRSILIAKHEVFDEVLKISKTKCITDVDNCPHQLQLSVQESIHVRELDHYKKKIIILDECRDEIVKRCNSLEKTLILLNQGFDKPALENVIERKTAEKIPHLELEEVQSDDEPSSRRSETITLKKPHILKSPKCGTNIIHAINTVASENSLPGSPIRKKSVDLKKVVQVSNVYVQTIPNMVNTKSKLVQTDKLRDLNKLKNHINDLEIDNNKKSKEITEALSLAKSRTEEILSFQTTNAKLEDTINELENTIVEKNELIAHCKKSIDDLKKELDTINMKESTKSASDESKNLLNVLKELENDKNIIVREYKEILQNERDEYSKVTKELQYQISELQKQLNGKKEVSYDNEAVREISDKYTSKIVELEDQCFKLQSELDEYKNNITTAQCERERWKQLANERLTKMEQLNCQLEERHCNEVESYKAESQHWLSQLNASEREQTELRARLSELRATHSRQLAEKDAHIDQLRQTIHNLKSQIANMQTLISVNDPSFDLSAIVEVDEPNEGMSQNSSEQLELKFDGSFDEFQGDLINRIQASSSSIWQEPVVDRLRREKQLAGKQNTLLRRQIKALAGRERRARLEAQNLKNQIYRFSNSKSVTGENTALHNKIASLQAQLVAARRDTQSNVALWDKWKRSQQTAERWQVRYEEKCQEVRKLETSLNYAKSAVARLEREKRALLSKTAELKNDDRQLSLLKAEDNSKRLAESVSGNLENVSPIPVRVSAQSLMERVEAQQRRIAALELAEKGNEPLLSEYEKALAEITSLKGQILKLESSLLEAQIRSPMKSSPDPKPELEYWKSYCEMLKEENVQLSMRLSTIEVTPSFGQQRVNDLEQTVLTLRGLVSKLQAEQKSTSSYKRNDSRPNSGRSLTMDKGKNQLENYRVEIANLKRSIGDKDMLLDKSKEMLKVAAERVEQLLRENVFLRRKVDEEFETKTGYLSA